MRRHCAIVILLSAYFTANAQKHTSAQFFILDPAEDCFIPASFLEGTTLKLDYRDPVMQVWKGDINAEICRLDDERRFFQTKEEAVSYADSIRADLVNKLVLYPVPERYKMDVTSLYVFRESASTASFYAGLDTKWVEWSFLFVVHKTFVKISLLGSNISFERARSFANKAAEVTARCQKILYHPSHMPAPKVPDEMSVLLKRAKLTYDAPPGYFPANVKEYPYIKYHYAVAHPSGESEIRYYVLPFDTVAGAKKETSTKMLSESLVYSIFQTDVRNIRGVAEKNLPQILEIRQEKLAKSYNADKGWVTYLEPKSVFAQGYLYGMITCLYKKGTGMVYIMHLAKDRKWFSAEPQITPFTVRFSN